MRRADACSNQPSPDRPQPRVCSLSCSKAAASGSPVPPTLTRDHTPGSWTGLALPGWFAILISHLPKQPRFTAHLTEIFNFPNVHYSKAVEVYRPDMSALTPTSHRGQRKIFPEWWKQGKEEGAIQSRKEGPLDRPPRSTHHPHQTHQVTHESFFIIITGISKCFITCQVLS